MGLPWKGPLSNLPLAVRRKILGRPRLGGLDSSLATARGESTIMPWAPSEPRAFCQLQVTTSSLDHSTSIANTAEVASHRVRPSRSAGIQSALGTRTPEVVPFQVNTASDLPSYLVRSGSSPYPAWCTRTL